MKLSTNFTLKTGMTGQIPVLAIINFGYKEFDLLKKVNIYKPLRYYTGMRLSKEEWNSKEKLPFDKQKQVDLFILQKQIEDIFNYLRLKGDAITPDLLKKELDEKVKGKTAPVVINRIRLIDFIQQEFLASTSLKATSKKPYQGLINKLELFEAQIGKHIYSTDVDERLYKQFMDVQKNRVTRMNALWSIDKNFRAVLNEIARKYKVAVFKPGVDLAAKDRIHSTQEDKLYLNFEQIQKIIDYGPENDREKNVKLILLTLLFTGCRSSDVHKIKADNVYDKNGLTFRWSRYISEKTNTEIIVPILKPLADALEENDGNPPYYISPQKFNEYVKELAQKCELDEEVSFTFTDAHGKKRFESKPMYQFVSSHIGRRSFVTNLINFVPITILTKITGHELKDKSIIFSYNKVSLIDNSAQFVRELQRVCRENPEHFVVELV